MLQDILSKGTNAIRNNFNLFTGGTLVKKNPVKPEEQLLQRKYNKLWGETNPLTQDRVVTGLDAIKLNYTHYQTGKTNGLLEDGLAAGAVVATGLVAFKATQGGVSLLTGGSG